MRSLFIGTLVSSLLASAACATGQDADAKVQWFADFDLALAKAQEEKKDLLVDFTGSDWCGWCIRLDEEVFSHGEFEQGVADSFVLVKLDFPRGEEAKAKVPNPARNEELNAKFAVTGYPTILLLSAEEEVLGRTGYQPGGPKPYLEHLHKMRTAARSGIDAVKSLVADFEGAEGEEKVEVWEKAMQTLTSLEVDSSISQRLVPIIKFAFQADPENEKGLKIRAIKSLLVAGLADEATLEAGRDLDPKNEQGVLERITLAQCESVNDLEQVKGAAKAIDDLLAMAKVQDELVAFKLHVNRAFWNKQFLDDPAKAKESAKVAMEIGTDDPNLRQFLESIVSG